MSDLSGKKIVMIVASNGYRDEEFDVPKDAFIKENASVKVASSSLIPAKGVKGGSVKPNMLVKDINPDDFDAVVFVGGNGSTEYWNDKNALELAKKTYEMKKVIAAICIAPVILANAGILKDKKATVYPSEIVQIKQKGGIYQEKDGAVRDGNIITANGPQSAENFAILISQALSGKK